MKKQKQLRKLSLNKETISNLSRKEMSLVQGGGGFLSIWGQSCKHTKCLDCEINNTLSGDTTLETGPTCCGCEN